MHLSLLVLAVSCSRAPAEAPPGADPPGTDPPGTDPPTDYSGEHEGGTSTEPPQPPCRGRLRALSGAVLLSGAGLDAATLASASGPTWTWLGEDLVALGDLDGDGLSEVVAEGEYGLRVVVPSADLAAGGALDPTDWIAFEDYQDAVAAGDVTGDGVPDLILTGGNSVTVSSGADLLSGVRSVAVFDGAGRATGDLDGDGIDDLFVLTALPDGAYEGHLFYGPITGSSDQDAPAAVFDGLDATGAGDLDGDGRADLVSFSRDSEVVAFSGAALGSGVVTDADATWTMSGPIPGWIELTPIGDLDQDGHADLMFDDWESLALFSGATPDRWRADQPDASISWGQGHGQALSTDLDGDGHPELLLLQPSEDGRVALTLSIVEVSALPLTADAPDPIDLGPGGEGGAARIAPIGDLDGDGVEDLVLGEPYAECLWTWSHR